MQTAVTMKIFASFSKKKSLRPLKVSRIDSVWYWKNSVKHC